MTRREVGHWPPGIVCRDVRQGLGWTPGSVAAIYSSHFIEHLRRDEALRFLRECKLALRPGGVCRVVTPDLRALATRYIAAGESNGSAADEFMKASLLAEPNGASAHGMLAWYRRHTRFDAHKWLYDAASLSALFQEAGFAAPESRRYLESRIPAALLQRVENRERIEDGAGIVVEAIA
jgi:predicted SAM-dependent methyltransferase